MHGTIGATGGSGVAVLESALTMKDAAAKLRVSERHLWKLVRDNKIPSFMHGGRRWILGEGLDLYLARQIASGNPPKPAQPPSHPPAGPRPPAGPSDERPPAGPKVGGDA